MIFWKKTKQKTDRQSTVEVHKSVGKPTMNTRIMLEGMQKNNADDGTHKWQHWDCRGNEFRTPKKWRY